MQCNEISVIWSDGDHREVSGTVALSRGGSIWVWVRHITGAEPHPVM